MEKYSVGFTGGVFDILHVGHINIINKARKMCDRLIVGVQRDGSVVKTKPLPILNENERFEQVKKLGIADEVVFYGDNVIDVLEKYDVKIFIHGDDWESQTDRTDVLEFMAKRGIVKELLPRTEGISTTDIKKRIVYSHGQEQLIQKVQYAHEFCEFMKKELGYDVYLEYGSLLGCVREQGVIKGDYDIDLCVCLPSNVRGYIHNGMVDLFWSLRQHGLIARVFSLDGDLQSVDIKSRESLFNCCGQAHVLATNYGCHGIIQLDLFTSWVDRDGHYIMCRFGDMGLASQFFPLKKGILNGYEFNIPNNPEIILEKLYGDWRTPSNTPLAEGAPIRGWRVYEDGGNI